MLIAFHGNELIKTERLSRIETHVRLDNLQKRATGQDGKGCAVWCTMNQYNHSAYEDELGIPEVLAHLEDRIFEGSSLKWSKTWPGRFIAAIPVGADLSQVWPKFAVWLLVDPIDGALQYAAGNEKCEKAIRAVASAYERHDVKREEWLALRDANAYAAAYAANAANAAAYAAAAYAAAAYANAYAAAYANAYAAANAANAANAFERQGEKLLELMAAAPILQVA